MLLQTIYEKDAVCRVEGLPAKDGPEICVPASHVKSFPDVSVVDLYARTRRRAYQKHLGVRSGK